MTDIKSVYNEVIMDHYMMSPYKKELDNFTCESMGVNPSCGDEIKLQLLVEDNVIKDIAYTGEGCAISLSSSSIMIDTIKGKSIEDAKNIISIFKKMINKEILSNEEITILKDSYVFLNIANMPARMKCALLSWQTIEKMLDEIK